MVVIPSTKTSVAQPDTFTGFDDAERIGNGGVPDAGLAAAYCDALNSIAAGGRIIRTFWGGDDTTNTAALRRFLWDHRHSPASRLQAVLIVLRPNGSSVNTGTPSTSQAIELTLDDHNGHNPSSKTVVDYDLSGLAQRIEPQGVEMMTFEISESTLALFEVTLGSLTANGLSIVAGMLYERAESTGDASVGTSFCPSDHIASGRDIVTEPIGASASILDTFRANFNHTAVRKRPSIQWDAIDPGSSVGYREFTTSTQAYRYIHDQTIGDGGTAPAASKPAVTLPLANAGRGIYTTVPVSLRVYAAMSGTTNAGKVGVSHRDGSGGMTPIGDVITGITGTTYAWYPALTSTAATFLGQTNLPYERIVLCAKSTGATDKVRIGAYSMTVIPAVNVT